MRSVKNFSQVVLICLWCLKGLNVWNEHFTVIFNSIKHFELLLLLLLFILLLFLDFLLHLLFYFQSLLLVWIVLSRQGNFKFLEFYFQSLLLLWNGLSLQSVFLDFLLYLSDFDNLLISVVHYRNQTRIKNERIFYTISCIAYPKVNLLHIYNFLIMVRCPRNSRFQSCLGKRWLLGSLHRNLSGRKCVYRLIISNFFSGVLLLYNFPLRFWAIFFPFIRY